MAITLSDVTTTINLHEDLYWEDEFTWHPVEQSAERTVTGALIVDVNTRTSGRPITLRPEDDRSAWMARSVLEQLRNWAAVPGKTLTLTLRGVARTVMFRHHEGPAVEPAPVIHYNDTDAADRYTVTVRFMEVSA